MVANPSGQCKRGFDKVLRMMRFLSHRGFVIAIFLVAVLAVAAGVWRYAYLQALEQLSQRGQADLTLASDRLIGQLQRYQELAVLMADHPMVDEIDAGQVQPDARALLLEVADKTAALDVLYADVSGQVLVAAHGVVGQSVADTAFFKRAMQGALGTDHGVNGPLGVRAYYFAAPSFAPDGQVRGTMIVAVDIADMEWDWQGSNPAVFFTDVDGRVFITNRSEILFWQRLDGQAGLRPAQAEALPFQSGFIGEHEIWTLNWGPYLPRRAMHLVRPLPVIGMTGEVLVDAAPARRLALLQATLVAALFLVFGALMFMATERRRTLALANARLESRVKERTLALSDSNQHLRREVAERQEAEAALKQAQDDLVQAGKLSALGQMSAGISHELNQPLMAIQQFADNGQQYMERGRSEVAAENLGRISDLARRMGRIIKNLRAFSRQESEAAGRVDVVAVLDSVIELTGARLRQDGISVTFQRPDHPVWVRGGEVRLGQVFVNLVTNAADAMAQSRDKQLILDIQDGQALTVTVRDTGPGIDVPDKVFEPFYSTKEVGASEGMGLGLSISYGIVQSFGGDIHGGNAPEGGAMFTVRLEPWVEEQAA